MSSQDTKLEKQLKQFIYETARRKGRTWEKVTLAQLKVTEEPVGVSSPISAVPKTDVTLSNQENIDGLDRTIIEPANGSRVTPQDTANLIASIRAHDDADEAVKSLSGDTMTFTIDLDEDFLMTPKFAVSRRKSTDGELHKKHVPTDSKGKYLMNALDFGSPLNWDITWENIATKNLRRVM